MTSIKRQDVLNMLLFDTQYTGLDNRLLTLVGHDKDENILFGVSRKSHSEKHHRPFGSVRRRS